MIRCFCALAALASVSIAVTISNASPLLATPLVEVQGVVTSASGEGAEEYTGQH
jgi:hypothetical protein